MKNKKTEKAIGCALIIFPILILIIIGVVLTKPTIQEILVFLSIVVSAFIMVIIMAYGSYLIQKNKDDAE